MTDLAVRAAAATPARTDGSRSRPPAPGGVPRWIRYFGVSIRQAGGPDSSGTYAWMVSAGAGTTGVAAVFYDTDANREDPS